MGYLGSCLEALSLTQTSQFVALGGSNHFESPVWFFYSQVFLIPVWRPFPLTLDELEQGENTAPSPKILNLCN